MQGQPPQKKSGPESSFHVAFAERRKMNLDKLKQHMTARGLSQSQRTRIFGLLQGLWFEKVALTKQFIRDISKYFEDTLSLYSSFFKGVGKLDLSKHSKEQFVYEAFAQAALELTELNTSEVESLRALTGWVEKLLLPALKALMEMYRQWTKEEAKHLQDLQSQTESSRQKENKFYIKIGESSDLLQNEIVMLEKMQVSDECLVRWGKRILSGWQGLLKEEGGIREQLQRNIMQFHQKFTRVYSESDASRGLLKFWEELESVPTWHRTFASVLSEKQIQFINFGCDQQSLERCFEPFIDLVYQKERIGDPILLLQILQNKKFKCKLQRSQREYVELKVYFTVDKNVLLLEHPSNKLVMKLKEQSFKASRASENLVEVSGLEEGFLLDSKRRQNLHFSTMDEAEEFVFFVGQLRSELGAK